MYLQKVLSRKTLKKIVFVGVLKVKDGKKLVGSGSTGQMHGSTDLDLYQNVMDPQH
jgi:hypothetical protein